MRRPVLIVDVEPRITIPIARSLHKHDVPVDLACFGPDERPLRSRAISGFVSLPDPHRQPHAFVEELVRTISNRGYDMLIPATDAALETITRYDANLRQLLYVACPPAEVVQRVLNKSLTLELARKAGIRVPQTYRLSNVGELERVSDQLRFPMVAKPYHKSGETDFKVRHFENYDSLRRALEDDAELGSRILLQEFAAGDGVGIEALMHDGQPVAMFQHRRLKEVPATGGAAAVAISEPLDSLLVDQALALLRALEWEGVAMVEFRYDRNQKQSALMEVNGRYWGTVALPIRAGVDFPWYEWQIAHGEEPTISPSYSVGICWRWSAGYVRRWHGLAKNSARKASRRPMTLKELVPSFKDLAARDAIWDAADPMPAITDSLRTLKHLADSDFGAILRAIRRNGTRRSKNSVRECTGDADG